jgi:hypothetical protein
MYRIIFISCLIYLTPLTLSADDELPRTGRYSVTTEVKSETPLPFKINTTEHCLKTEDFTQDPVGILANQPENADHCEITQFSMKNGKVELLMNCTPDNGTMNMKITGSYSTTSYSIYSDMQLEMNGLIMNMTSITKAKRLGDC